MGILTTHDQGDDMDRVIVRADGRPTYLLPDIAYHRDKRDRGFRRAINLWGPDHHAYVTTLTSALKALGLEDDFLKVQIVQYVKLMQGDEEVKMSKRLGQFETLADLVEEVGSDCARFFFLQLSSNAHLKFDMEKAKERSDKNPAFYVQYAHAQTPSWTTSRRARRRRWGASSLPAASAKVACFMGDSGRRWTPWSS